MQTPIDRMQEAVENGAKALFIYVQQAMESLGSRPFMGARMTPKQELEAYQALRNTQDGMYYYADGIRKELDSRLAQFSAEERLALGYSDSEIRRIAYLLTLKYDDRMKKTSKRLGIPIEGLDLVPEPLLPVEEEVGGEEWLSPGNTPVITSPISMEGTESLPSPLSPTEPILPSLI